MLFDQTNRFQNRSLTDGGRWRLWWCWGRSYGGTRGGGRWVPIRIPCRKRVGFFLTQCWREENLWPGRKMEIKNCKVFLCFSFASFSLRRSRRNAVANCKCPHVPHLYFLVLCLCILIFCFRYFAPVHVYWNFEWNFI